VPLHGCTVRMLRFAEFWLQCNTIRLVNYLLTFTEWALLIIVPIFSHSAQLL